MPFNGSGVFQRVRSWVADAAAGIKIRADYHDAEDDGLAAGLTNCITKDGQSVITQNIPFNNKRITGLADPVNAQDAATKASVAAQVTTVVSTTTLQLTGGTMTGPLILSRDPVDPMEASTKQYTDARDAATQAAAVAAAKAAGDIAYQAKDPQLFSYIPINNQGNGYTSVLTDSAKCLAGTGVFYINSALYQVGTVITLAGYAGALTVVCSGATMYWYNNGPQPGNRVIGDRGIATIIKTPDGNWIFSGNGIT